MALAFIGFIAITVFILQTIVLGTIYDNYRRHAVVCHNNYFVYRHHSLQSDLKKMIIHQRRRLKEAWLILSADSDHVRNLFI